MSGPEFFQTRMGHVFYESTMPEIARQLKRIADALEALGQGRDEAKRADDAPTRRALNLYDVATEKFGIVVIQAHDIEDARRDARKRFGITNPDAVTRQREYAKCERCESAPCCCPEVSR